MHHNNLPSADAFISNSMLGFGIPIVIVLSVLVVIFIIRELRK